MNIKTFRCSRVIQSNWEEKKMGRTAAEIEMWGFCTGGDSQLGLGAMYLFTLFII
jgi:hypothetical protein